jgi:FKBP-type peptidyl-prolyl cis-trans isomerase FklB
MKRLVIVIAMVFAGTALAQDELKTPKEKRSYALGMSYGNQFKSQSVDIDPAILAQALKDVLSGGKLRMTEEQAANAIAEMEQGIFEKLKAQAATNKTEGQAFLDKNRKAQGVTTRENGLQIKIINPGKGKKPGSDDIIVCQWKGTLINGTEFINSYKQNQPVTIPMQNVPFQGLALALPDMQPGAKWQLFIPPELAYGDRIGNSPVPPNSTLIFEIELLEIKSK